MRKRMVFDDPTLERAFGEAYRAAMHEVERLEGEKTVVDSTEAFASLFAEELEHRDLSPEERDRCVRAFRESVGRSRREIERRSRRRHWLTIAAGGGACAAGALALLIYLGAARPFASLPRIEADLAQGITNVEAGYGRYARDYYRTLDRFRRRLGDTRVTEYDEQMRAALDQGFRSNLARVEAGDIAYIDDALQWAGYFHDREERVARRQQVQNAALGSVGQKLEETARTVVDGARDLIDRAVDAATSRSQQ